MATSLELPRAFTGLAPTMSPGEAPPCGRARIRIGRLQLDPDTLELAGADRTEVLRPLPAALLFHLLRNRHRIVPKDELHRVLWPGTCVSDAALASAVRDLRRLLDDDGEAQELVRTFRGRGYRLVAPVEIAEGDRPAPSLGTRGTGGSPALRTAQALVGRERELARFERCLSAVEGGRGGSLLVESVAGGGRTAFLEQCARRTQGVLWLGVACDLGAWVPRCDAITQLLLALEGAVGSERFDDWVRHDPDIAQLLPDTLPGRGAARARVEALAAALQRTFERASAIAPVVLALDDVHAIDRASLDLLCAGAARSALLLGTADPALISGFARSGLDALFSERSRIRLPGLTAADISALAADLPQARSDPRWADRVRERTGGHPADVLAVIDELGRAAREPEHAAELVPRAVFERLSARIDALSRPARAVVTAAAALPPGAPLELIRRLADAPSASDPLPDPVAECVAAGLLCLRAEPVRIELAAQFARHVALAKLPAARRRELERTSTEMLRQNG